MAEAAKPRVLILGGVGFVGRHLTTFLVKGQLCSKLRVVDKVPPAIGWLNEEHKAAFSQVEFVQANLVNPASAEKVFACDDAAPFDLVYNLATETKYSQSDEVYKERVIDVALSCAREAAKTGVKKFIHLSTAQVYNCDKGISSENSKLAPWTALGRYNLLAEKAMRDVPGLSLITVRPAIIYGVADKQGITPRIVTAACYRELKEKMKLLWTKDLQMNTVHVSDVVSALWHLSTAGSTGEVYNLADQGFTTQGKISQLVSTLFGIQHDYFGTVLSNLARLNMRSATEDSNEKHLAPWSDACLRDGISNTPLSPYLDQELLYNKHLHINGHRITATGFSYQHPRITIELLKEVVDDYVANGLFPRSLLPPPEQ